MLEELGIYMSNNLNKLIEESMKAEILKKNNYLAIIPDESVMTRELFKVWLRKFPHARQFGFSKKHTEEIEKIKAKNGASSFTVIYDLPVKWNSDVTYLK